MSTDPAIQNETRLLAPCCNLRSPSLQTLHRITKPKIAAQPHGRAPSLFCKSDAYQPPLSRLCRLANPSPTGSASTAPSFAYSTPGWYAAGVCFRAVTTRHLTQSQHAPHNVAHRSNRRIAVRIATADASSRKVRARRNWKTFRYIAAARAVARFRQARE